MLFINVILPVFFVALAGYFVQLRLKLDLRPLTDSSLFLFTPALVFSSLLKHPLETSQIGSLLVFAAGYTVTMTLVAIICARCCRFEGNVTRALILTTAMMNVGNFGLPLVMFAYGSEALNASVLTFVLFNFVLGSYAIIVAQGGTSLRDATVNMLRIPILHATVLAVACRALDLQPPDFILRPIELLGGAAVPLMLSLLGMQLANLTSVSGWGFCGLATMLRLVVGPAVAVLLAWLLGIEGLTRKVLILQTSTPAAVLTLLYSVRYNTRPELVSGVILTSTLLSAASLTALLYWMG